MSRARDAVLLSWVSVNHRAAPLLTAIRDPKSPLRGRVRRLYLCYRDTPAPEGDREREALGETTRSLRESLASGCPEIVELAWKTRASPTDHKAILPFAESALQRARAENGELEVAIHLSPGTPAMHAVWLVLGTTGYVAEPLSLLQTADERARTAGQDPVQLVQLDLETWLRRYRATRPGKTGTDDDGHAWEPHRAKSPALRAALAKLAEWAPLRVPVLLIGERGTGKTTLANMLRAMSPFQKAGTNEWPSVVCGQFRVNPQLARSELFGHAKGAFTGATADRVGLLEEANGETLFFDEIGDIDRDTQRLLMAALEGRGFHRVGETKVRQSSFRLVCATNRSLGELSSQLLDADFFDRLAMFVLEVPPLRTCREDLPDAWSRVLREALKSAGVRPLGWERFVDHRGVLGELANHPLPGNFRDLQRAAYHLLAALQAGREEAHVVRAARDALGDSPASRPHGTGEAAVRLPVENLRKEVNAYERRWLQAALQRAGGNIEHDHEYGGALAHEDCGA